jgi:hypothetical protein
MTSLAAIAVIVTEMGGFARENGQYSRKVRMSAVDAVDGSSTGT